MAAAPPLTLRDIVAPYLHPQETPESAFYNTFLERTITKIREVAQFSNEACVSRWQTHLQKLFITNNQYVVRRLREVPFFSLHFCAKTNDGLGLRYLLRTGANPNVLERGMAPIHLAVLRGAAALVKVLVEHPEYDPSIKTVRGQTAFDLAKDEEMRSILNMR